MSFLKRLRRKLHQTGEIEERPQKPVFEVEEISPKEEEWKELPPTGWQKLKARKNLLRVIGGLVLVLIILFILALTVFRDSPIVRRIIFREIFRAKEVSLEIEGGPEIKGGREITYLIKYANLTKVSLSQVELTFEQPEGFSLTFPQVEEEEARVVTWSLDDLGPRSQGSFEIKGTMLGQEDETKTLKAKLRYIPANFQSYFETSASLEVTIISVPLILNLDLPGEIISGRSISYILDYLNTSEITFSKIRIKFEYPSGFTFSSADPEPTEADNIWDVEKMIPDQLGQIRVAGSLTGGKGENKSLKVIIGLIKEGQFVQYNETSSATEIIISPLVISQTINDEVNYIAEAGDTLEYEIEYKNETNQGIRDVVLTSQLTSPVLDFETLEIEKGVFDSQTKTISWEKSSLPELAFLSPGQGGTLSFKVKVKEYLPINNFNDKNFVITNLVRMSGTNIPDWIGLSENSLVTKVNSRLVLNARGYYSDPVIANSGPIPPQVGQTTTYTIHWQLINLANDIQEVKVEGSLPGNVEWTGKSTTLKGELKYSQLTREITWQIEKLSANTGILAPVQEAIFQLSITPSANQVGRTILLIEESNATGQDSFTETELTSSAGEVSTDCPDDPSISRNQGKVVE